MQRCHDNWSDNILIARSWTLHDSLFRSKSSDRSVFSSRSSNDVVTLVDVSSRFCQPLHYGQFTSTSQLNSTQLSWVWLGDNPVTSLTSWRHAAKKGKSSTLAIVLLTWDGLKTRSPLTILKVAADSHELMIPQHSMRPSIACLSEQLDPRFAASRHTTTLISHTVHRPHVVC